MPPGLGNVRDRDRNVQDAAAFVGSSSRNRLRIGKLKFGPRQRARLVPVEPATRLRI